MQVLAALDYAHARGVVHRDIKPANMMLTPEGVVKLMDFGIARSSADHKLTQTGTTVGSLYYMSPEQIQGVTAPDARSDLYSVGVSLYELVTGKRPFDGDSQFAIMSAHLQGTPVPPVSVDPRLPQLLNDVILMSVAKDANARFQTAGALRNALSNVASVKPAEAAPAPGKSPAAARPVAAVPVGQLAQPAQTVSHRGAWIGLGAVAALLAMVVVIAIAPWKGTRAAPAKVAAPAAQPAASEPPAPVAPQPQPEPQAPAPQAAAPAPVSRPVSESPRIPSGTAGAAKTIPAVSQSAGAAPIAAGAAQPPAPAPAPQQPVQQRTPQQGAVPTGPSRAELQQVREHIAMLGVRASGVRTSLQSLQRSQAASGLNLRGDMQEASNLMTTYLNGADAALNAGDVEQSRSFADKAERQLEKLEKFLNR